MHRAMIHAGLEEGRVEGEGDTHRARGGPKQVSAEIFLSFPFSISFNVSKVGGGKPKQVSA